jgi:hypothetical protein
LRPDHNHSQEPVDASLASHFALFRLFLTEPSAMGRNQGALKSAQNEEELVNDEEEQVVVQDANVSASPPAKKPRKKSQAFGVPKTAARKAK